MGFRRAKSTQGNSNCQKNIFEDDQVPGHHPRALTLSQPGGGGHIVPPQVHFLKYLRNALSYGLETFWQFKWIKLKNKNLFFNRLRPPLVTIATFKVDACFWKAHFGSFHAKAYQNSMFFATPTKNGRTVVCCENLG